MNTFKQPEIEVIKFAAQDIVTTSDEHDNAFGDITDLLSAIASRLEKK